MKKKNRTGIPGQKKYTDAAKGKMKKPLTVDANGEMSRCSKGDISGGAKKKTKLK